MNNGMTKTYFSRTNQFEGKRRSPQLPAKQLNLILLQKSNQHLVDYLYFDQVYLSGD